MNKTLIIPIILSLCACSGTIAPITPNEQISTERQLPTIAPGNGQLCVFRFAGIGGWGVTFHVKANYNEIGSLSGTSYFCANLPAGEYALLAESWGTTKAGSEVVIRPGERKYMELSIDSLGMTFISYPREIGLGGISQVIK